MAETTALVPAAFYAPMHDHTDNHLASGESFGRLWRIGQEVWEDISDSEIGSWYGPSGRLVTRSQVGTLLDIFV